MNNGVYKEYLRDRKTIITLFSMTLAFILCILLSFGTRFFFKPIDESFVSDLAISFALCVYCLFFGVPEGKNLYQKKIGGRYDLAKRRFLDERENCIGKDNALNQWLDNYYIKRREEYFQSILSLHGITNMLVLDLDRSELELLSKPYKKCWKDTEFSDREDTYFRSLNDNQINLIRDIFDGKIHAERIPNDFFKTLDGKIVLSEYLKQARAGKRNSLTYFSLIIYRLVMVFVFAFVFSCFGYEILENATYAVVVEQCISTVFRIWTMITSFVYGFAVGQLVSVKESEILEFKCSVIKEFINDKEFKPLNEEEIAKKDYEEYKKNVVEPEVIRQETSSIALPYNTI